MWRLTDEQRALRERVREIVLEQVRPLVRDADRSGEYPQEICDILAREGLLGLSIPTELGGHGTSTVVECACIEEFAKISGAVSLMAAYVKLAALPHPPRGDRRAEAPLPPRAVHRRDDRVLRALRARRRVRSRRAPVPRRAPRRHLGPERREALHRTGGLRGLHRRLARTGEEGSHGISAFVVPAGSPGFTSEPLETMGMPGWRLGTPRLENVEVPHANLLGKEGDGFKIAMAAFHRSRCTVAAQAVGLGQGAIDLALDYAARRHTFGKPLLAHQGIQFKLAGMEADVAAARALTFQAATFVDEQDERMTKLASASKLVASDTAMRVTTEAVQVLGGNGYLTDFPAERMMRDAKVLQIYEGANEIQRLVIAREMAEQAAAREPVWSACMPGASGVPVGA